ncbi:MAG TPA: tRNA uridine-5-carboxymethylaminomethyl(34) synthesis GTPase MnmE [Micavibrio sp.]|nr:tRNA uridine-5-carboxymethylaminomethyl(34) synthesis GTPase MnmE [Micavibrio sp.]
MNGGETIFALSSARGKAGVAVVRVSGPAAMASFKKLANLEAAPAPRQTLLRAIADPRDHSMIDRALIVPFKAPASFTGEDVVEYHLHGSPAVVDGLLSALSSFENHRMAEPGEFTRRAFENGKLDLTEAEAVADLINAETQLQKQQALLQMNGALSSLYEGWRARLIRTMAYIEAVIDFPDEDVPDSETRKVLPELAALTKEIESHLNDNRRGERLRDGIHIAIVGAPNAGKSSLLNLLARRDVAIVSPVAGTTRDVIEAHLDLGGYPVILADTAGLRPEEISEDGGHGSIESEGIRRALERAQNADLRLLVFDGTEKTLNPHTEKLRNEYSLVVYTKKDAAGFRAGKDGISLSSTTGDGLDSVLAALTDKIKSLYALTRETPSLTRARHRDALADCVACLQKAQNAQAPELMAEDIRVAARSLGRITGRVDVEDLLDVIFRDFCIGK